MPQDDGRSTIDDIAQAVAARILSDRSRIVSRVGLERTIVAEVTAALIAGTGRTDGAGNHDDGPTAGNAGPPACAADDGNGIGSRIKAMRLARGWSLQGLARRAGLSKPYVWDLERGRSANIGTRSLRGIAAAFGVSVSTLLDGGDGGGGQPIPMILYCPACGVQHVDAPGPGWDNPPHRSHLCRPEDGGCGAVWRPADVPTAGVRAIGTRGAADTYPPAAAPAVPGGQTSIDGGTDADR